MNTPNASVGALLLLLCVLAASAHAAETPPGEAPATTEPAAEAPAEAAADAADEPAGADDEETATRPSEDVFVPSVEVSEDTSVPFPVDI